MVAGRRLRVLVGQGVHRPDHSIGLDGGHQVGDRGRVPVALAELDPRPDAQVGKASAAPVDLLEVGTDLQGTAEEAAMLVEGPAILRWHGSVMEGPRGQVDVFGERQSGQADGDGAGARGVHVSLRGVPGELAVDVTVGRQHQATLAAGGGAVPTYGRDGEHRSADDPVWDGWAHSLTTFPEG